MAADPYAAVPSVMRELYYAFGTPGDTGVEYNEEGVRLVAKRMIDVVHHADVQEVLKDANSIKSPSQG